VLGVRFDILENLRWVLGSVFLRGASWTRLGSSSGEWGVTLGGLGFGFSITG